MPLRIRAGEDMTYSPTFSISSVSNQISQKVNSREFVVLA
jgi:hypothetical protein